MRSCHAPHPGVRGRALRRHLPDAPVSKFVLTMRGGNKGLLVNSTDICAQTNRAVAKFTAQNGKLSDTTPVVANSCKRRAHQKSHGRHRRGDGRAKRTGARK